MVILQLSRYVFAFLHSFLFHPFSPHTSSLASCLFLSPFSRPQPAEHGSTLATLESRCGEDFAIASQQVSILVFVWLLPALDQFEFQDAGAAMYASFLWPLFQPRFPSFAGFKFFFVFLYF